MPLNYKIARILRIDLPFNIKNPILAIGGDTKNSLCFANDRSAFITEAVGDLQILDNFKKFKKGMTSIYKLFGLKPRIIAYDKHPEYFSTKYILSLPRYPKARLIAVQHHHAHIASCMIENKLINQRVIGAAFDGTGFSDDQTLWGAEFLIADYKNFKRAGHLRYIPLLGGNKAIYEPWRIASAWLYLIFGDNFLDLDINFTRGINRRDWSVLRKIWQENFNAPLASSMGRLFDAIAALVLGIKQVKFEAQAAINLERVASAYKYKPKSYGFRIRTSKRGFVIDPALTFKEIIADLINKRRKEGIAASFHMTVANMISKACLRIRNDTRINTVILTGGVFQNKILLELSRDLLRKSGFQVLIHNKMPCSDASISLGQMAVASFAN